MEPTPDMFLPGMYQYQIKLRDNLSTPVPDGDVQNIRVASEACATGTTMIIEATYGAQISNPNNEDFSELMLHCLVDTGVISDEDGYTKDDLERALMDEKSDLVLDFQDEQTISCMVNPAQNGINGNPLILPDPTEATPNSSRLSRAEKVAEVRQNPESELEARVLQDGVVSTDEYNEAVNAYLACMSDAGYEMLTSANQFVPGMYDYAHDSSATPEAERDSDRLFTTSDDCSVGTTMNIEAIFGDQIVNPDDVDIMALTVSCLETTGVVESGVLTPEYLTSALSQETPDLPFDLWEDQAMSCLLNPAQNGINGNPLILPDSLPATPPANWV